MHRFLECVKVTKVMETVLSFLVLSDLMNISQLTVHMRTDITIQKMIKNQSKSQIIQVRKREE